LGCVLLGVVGGAGGLGGGGRWLGSVVGGGGLGGGVCWGLVWGGVEKQFFFVFTKLGEQLCARPPSSVVLSSRVARYPCRHFCVERSRECAITGPTPPQSPDVVSRPRRFVLDDVRCPVGSLSPVVTSDPLPLFKLTEVALLGARCLDVQIAFGIFFPARRTILMFILGKAIPPVTGLGSPGAKPLH